MLLYSQPIVSARTGEREQEELLLRMPGADGTVVPAGRFVPAAEQFKMIKEIDRWVIPHAVAACAAVGRPVQFNLSAASIQDPQTPVLIEDALEGSGVNPADLVIEVTESGLIDEHAVAERFAHRIVGTGCRLALDDFGTGYGGFTYLTRLPVSILKIDRSFISDLGDDSSRKVVSAVVGLGREFGHTTVAEGVEDEETLATLRDMGVDQVQGYLTGRPAPL
jgi:EAL domain-containing protein (putative c-di-GMP-specific phosphodiesterase class I)